MKLGAYTAVLHDKPLPEALAILRGMGLESAEINSGGFLPAPHLPIADIRASAGAREEYLGVFTEAGMTLTALNCNGNPLHPDPEVREQHAQDLRDAIELGALLGVQRVVTMSGLPGAERSARLPSWTVLPWESAYLDARDYQWNEVALPFWPDIQARAADVDSTTSSTTPRRCCGSRPRSTPRTWGPRWTPATCSGRASTRSPRWPRWASWSTTPPPRTPASTRRRRSTACWTT